MWDLKSFVIGMIELIRLRFHFIVTEEFHLAWKMIFFSLMLEWEFSK